MFGVNSKYLTAKEDFVFSMIHEMIFTSQLEDEKRLYEIIARQKARLQSSLSEAGHATAVTRVMSYYSPTSNFQDRTGGIAYYRLLEKIYNDYENEKEVLKENLKKLMCLIFRPENLFVSVTTNEEGYSNVEQRIEKLQKALYQNPVETITKDCV